LVCSTAARPAALKVAELIQEAFGGRTAWTSSTSASIPKDLSKYDVLILGINRHWGGLQDEWAVFEDQLTKETLAGKTIAFFGLGDQKRYPDHFVDGIGLLYDKVKPTGVRIIGTWPRDDYDYTASAAELDGRLIGLALDEDNEPGKTRDRVRRWVRQLKGGEGSIT
jgi:flavodoxin I